MKARLHTAAIASVFLLAALAASAQTAWRCGNSYSQTPCADGTAVQIDDARTADQKKQTDSAASRDAKTADAMEKARLTQESQALRAFIFPSQSTLKEKPVEKPKTQKNKTKKAEPDDFTATDGKGKKKEAAEAAAKKKKKST